MEKVTLVILAALTVVVSGCSGMEVGHKFWVSRVDERSDHSRTYRKNVPLACYLWKNCTASQADEAEGS